MLEILPLWAWLVAAFSVGTIFGVLMMGSILRESRQVQLTDRIVTMLMDHQQEARDYGEKSKPRAQGDDRSASPGHDRKGAGPDR